MKLSTKILLVVLPLILAMGCQQNNSYEIEEEGKIPKLARIEGKFAHEFEITKDPKLGTVPRQRLFQAGEQTASLLASKNGTFELEWEERGPTQISGRTRAIHFDLNDTTGSTVYAGGVGGGIWRHPNIGDDQQAWEKIGDAFENIAVTTITQDPKNPEVMYFGTGEGYGNIDAIRGLGIWRSMNGGENWEPAPGSRVVDFEFIQKMIAAPDGTVYVASRSGLYQTTDQGENFIYLLGENSQAESDDIADVDLAVDGTLYVAAGLREGEGIYRRDSGATNFVKLDFNLDNDNFERIEMAVSPSNPNRIFALLEGNGGECRHILRSDNRGNSWQKMSVPGAIGMSNFARNQAWYDLTLEIDPVNEDRVFIGGIDVLLTEDGGQTWNQVSQWFGRDFQEVHADQHNIVINPFDSRQALFSNDGGVYFCKDIRASSPVIERREIGYNTTQYYAADMHPTDDNFILGGTQDNGSHILDQAALNIGREVTGGDGAFCHIDQNNPDILITSYIYNSYWLSIDGGNNFTRANYGNRTGRFINPTDYDSETKTLYANFRGGNFLRLNGVDLLNTREDIIEVDTFNNASITALTVSPNISDRVYFGLTNGRLVFVDNASQVNGNVRGVQIAPELVNRGNISSIAIADGDEDHIIMTYSNYGVSSVWETRDGGANWTNVENNLPDMPVRWGIFAPENNDVFLLATEMGVWMSGDLDGEDTEWFPSNEGLANTRVDMLVKNENGTVLAATHGRGMFTTNSFKNLNVSFSNNQSFYFSDIKDIDPCALSYDTLVVDVRISKLPKGSVELNIEKSPEWPDELLLIDTILVFSEGDATTTQEIRVLYEKNSNAGKHLENVYLNLPASSDYQLGKIPQHRLILVENYLTFQEAGLEFSIYTQDSSRSRALFLRGNETGTRMEIMWTASELKALGMHAGPIRSIELYSYRGQQDSVIIDLSLSAGSFNFDEFPRGLPFSNHNELLLNRNYTWSSGINRIDFDQAFVWDGQSNLSLQFCLNNHQDFGDLRLVSLNTSSVQMVANGNAAGSDPCRIFTPRYYNNYKPVTGFISFPSISDNGSRPFQATLTAPATVVLDSSRHLMAVVTPESEDLCGHWRIDENDQEAQVLWLDGELSDRVYRYERVAGNTAMEAQIYFPQTSFNDFDDQEDIKILQCNVPLESASAADCQSIPLSTFEFLPIDSTLIVDVYSEEAETYFTLHSGQLVSNSEAMTGIFQVGPVPFSNILRVESEMNGELIVFNAAGNRIVRQNKINKVMNLKTASWAPGIYYIQLKNSNGANTLKVVK